MGASLPQRLSAPGSNPSVFGLAPSTARAKCLDGCLEAPLILNICRCERSTSVGNATCGAANRPFVRWRFALRPLAAPRVSPSVLSPPLDAPAQAEHRCRASRSPIVVPRLVQRPRRQTPGLSGCASGVALVGLRRRASRRVTVLAVLRSSSFPLGARPGRAHSAPPRCPPRLAGSAS